jgi:hypothetical protein
MRQLLDVCSIKTFSGHANGVAALLSDRDSVPLLHMRSISAPVCMTL